MQDRYDRRGGRRPANRDYGRRPERGGYGRPEPGVTATRGSHSKRAIFRRTVFLMLVCGVLLFIPLGWKLYDITIVHHEEYQRKATEQQTMDLSVKARRGDIYDTNGSVMAMSATVYDLILSPRDLVASVDKKDFTDKETKELDETAYNNAVAAKQDQLIRDLMALLPDLDQAKLDTQVHAVKYAYREIKTRIEEEDHKPIQEYITENKTSHYLYFVEGTKRYYPYSSLAAQVLGFVNAEGGAIGIEAAYDDLLEGSAGRVVTTKTGRGTQMYNSYSEFIDAIDGYDLSLTIDATIQSFAEKTLEEGIQAYDVRNGAFCLVMDPNTGAIKAMASSPDFDPNNYSKIIDSILEGSIEGNTEEIYEKLKANNTENLTDGELMEKAENQAYSDAVNTQWRSKVLDSRYEPGSTFKSMVLAAALEEGVVSENDTFYCSGSVTIPGWPKPIRCSKREGHGRQTLSQAFANSCNPAFIEIGRRLGQEKFYDYFEAFGFTEKTGIELPGEASLIGAFWDRDEMTSVDLATASFGQNFEVTPLQMMAAFSSVVNGGHLMKPYILQSVTAKDGSVIQSAQPTEVRQVISQETSQRCAAILEEEVVSGTGKNAYVAGYRIGGKTGSAETHEEGRTIVSFIGFAPVDDPKIAILLAFDRPEESSPGSSYGTTGVYISGGNMAAPKAGPLIAEILDYMGVEKVYSGSEGAAADVSTPSVTGKSVADAAKDLEKKGLSYRTVGQGDTVTRQLPAARTPVPGGSSVILYLGDAAPAESASVPNVVGLTYDAARKALEQAGFFMRASGTSTYYSNTTTATGQSLEGGSSAAPGTVVDVTFTNVTEDGAVETPD